MCHIASRWVVFFLGEQYMPHIHEPESSARGQFVMAAAGLSSLLAITVDLFVLFNEVIVAH